MIVEFFGISGVGKTTVCKKMYKSNNVKWPRYKLYENNNWLVRNIKKCLSIFVFLVFNIKWFIKLNIALKEYEVSNIKDMINLLFNGCSLKIFQNRCKNTEETYIFDEGVFQYIWAIYLRTNIKVKEDHIQNILNLFKIPEKIFIINANKDIIIKRLVMRNRKTKIMESEDISDRIEKMKKTQDDILLLAKEYLKYTQIVFLDTTEEIKDVKKIRI